MLYVLNRKLIHKIYNGFEAQLKANDDEIKRLKLEVWYASKTLGLKDL